MSRGKVKLFTDWYKTLDYDRGLQSMEKEINQFLEVAGATEHSVSVSTCLFDEGHKIHITMAVSYR